jgi:hypothetical protein
MAGEPAATSLQTGFTFDPRAFSFPFGRELSLAPLITAWERIAEHDPGVQGDLARALCGALARAPELRAPIEDAAVLARHPDLLAALMSLVFSTANWEDDCAAAIVPFQLRTFYATPSFQRLLVDGEGMLRARANMDPTAYATGRLLHAFDVVLRKFHGLQIDLEYPIILTVDDPASGLERHFRIQYDRRFLDVRARGPVAPLRPEERARLLANVSDVQVLAELCPPENFVFSGFVVLRAFDVTDQEVLSALKHDLIERESIVSEERFLALQQKLRTFFRRSDLRVSLAAFQDDRVLVLNSGCHLEHGCIFADSEHLTKEDFAGSVYERAAIRGAPLLVEDLATEPARTAIEDALLAAGTRNVLVAPLSYQDRVIGELELGSPHPGDLGPMSVLKLREVLPLFSMAVRRSLDELEARVQAVIKERCTAIHPSVEWRFRRAVLDSIEANGEEGGADLEPILFRDVYPLYAATDIRGSSVQRNLAIQADLGTHLALALEVLAAARAARSLPILDETAYRIERHARQIERVLSSGDEVTVLAFLRSGVEPLFQHLAGFGPDVRARIDAYRAALDPALGTVHRQRRAYEESVTLLTDTISAYLDAEEDLAQAMFPHYFERQRTDGVDYTIYVGRSLVAHGQFDDLYLRNLRLWQLMVTCGIARRTEAVRARLPIPLETTHLVLAHHAPLAIRFRFDEKRFDVDGAYDVRYEVIKKRIDKALVQGTGERITQPGRLAIVYSQPAEAAEYRGYLEYLRARGHVTGEIEDLGLEELQGVQGLRALRVAIDLAAPGPEPGGAVAEARSAAWSAGG